MIKLHRILFPVILIILTPSISHAQVVKQGSLTVVENDTRPFIDTLDYTKFTEEEKQVGMAVQDFAFQFFQKLYEMKPKEPCPVMSPYSLRQLLSIICNGTAGKTRRELCKLMKITPKQIGILNSYNKKLEWMTKNTGLDVTLKSTSSVWLQERFPVFRTFVSDSRNYYNADVRAVNFAEKATAHAINKWSSDNTNGLIPEIIEEKPMDCLLYMANALYFNALWTGYFSKASTHKADFKNADGSVSQVDMMRNKELTGGYFSDKDCDFLRLPFDFSMTDKDIPKKPYSLFSLCICLPHEGLSLDDLFNKWNHEHWIEAIKKTKGRPLDVKLPRFETRLNLDVKGVMLQMAPLSLFRASGDYSLLSPNNNLRISSIQQNAVFKVDEKGCEAAAVTHSIMVGADCDPWAPKPIPFYVDRPFIFAVQENGSNNILFLGAVKHL